MDEDCSPTRTMGGSVGKTTISPEKQDNVKNKDAAVKNNCFITVIFSGDVM